MEYTKNYKLPQWAETDRILMEDFNKAMANIEEGFSMQGTKRQEVKEQIQNGLLRMGEIYLRQRYDDMDTDVLTQEDDLLLNPLTGKEMAGTLDGAEWNEDEQVYIGRSPEVDRDFLRAYCTSYSDAVVSTEYRDVTALYEFTAPKDGTLQDFDINYFFYFTAANTAFTNGKLTFTAYEKQGSKYVSIYKKSNITLEETNTDNEAVTSAVTIPVEVPLRGGYDYRLALHVDSGQGVIGRIGFVIDVDGTDNSLFTVTLAPVTKGSHTMALPSRGRAKHAVAYVYYWQEESEGGVTATIDGISMEEVIRTETTEYGVTECELLFYGGGNYTATPELTLSLQCSGSDRLSLMQYGVFLL